MAISESDLGHLRRCVDLAREALDDGDEPFGSVLVSAGGQELFADRNRVKDGDATRHPEFEISRWAAQNLSPAERADAVVYTSGEHCAMCSAAHGWVGLGRIVYAGSTEQLLTWAAERGVPAGPVAPLAIRDVVPGAVVDGPATEFAEELRELHVRRWRRDGLGTDPSSRA
ncbi:nucleoside deaminase [Microbacterium sp. CIAB417]|uniref:nucleoside deaminase n=1 Tax=Microbacterium sp. CIAB417 TaxID=2860287 RepID=UPI001FABCAC5|nr:nucleoside deaminase [Microbacterium sp. CIAB417]